MARISLKHLPAAMRAEVIQTYGLDKRMATARGGSSPYADRLGQALDIRFPGRLVREYLPIVHRRYRIDFAFPLEKLAIEFDGYRYHGFSKKGFREGLERQNLLVMHGWCILRYSLTDVRDRLEDILLEVETALGGGSQRG